MYCQLIVGGELLCDEVLGGANEIIKNILLAFAGPGHVPSLAIFTAAAEVGHRVSTALLHPGQCRHGQLRTRKRRDQRVVKSAVAMQQCRLRACCVHQVLAAGDEHRDAGAVPGLEDSLLGHVVARIERQREGLKLNAAALGQVAALVLRRLCERGVGVKELARRRIGGNIKHRAEAGHRQVGFRRAVE